MQRTPGFATLSTWVRTLVPAAWAQLRSYEARCQKLATFYQVHQFHSGSLTDDTIANSMFLLQRTLRGLGYESEIFVEHCDRPLSGRVFEASGLPSFEDCVWIIHHSSGNDFCDRIAAGPPKKILMFHGLSPADFLAGTSPFAGYSRIERAQQRVDRDSVINPSADGHSAAGRKRVDEDLSDRVEDVTARAADQPQPLQVAWISTWNVRCGIAEHSKSLLQPLIDRSDGTLSTLTILCDDRTPASEVRGWVRIVPCWNGVEPSTERMSRAISTSNAQVVVIQHQPGLIGWGGLVELLNDQRVEDRKFVVALHAARRLLDLEPEDREAVLRSLQGVSRIFVHRAADLNLLKLHGLVSNVTLFPLGADAQYCLPLVQSLEETNRVVIGCYGFFLPGKGIDRLIEAFAALRKTWPKLWLQLTNAEYSVASRTELARCRDLARKLGVLGAIEWDTAFHTHEESMLKLAQCDLLVLPYDENKELASAALHSAMASGVPVAVTPVSVFDEAGEAVFRFDGIDVPSLANGIDHLLRDKELRQKIQIDASRWLVERNWGNLSRRLQHELADLSH